MQIAQRLQLEAILWVIENVQKNYLVILNIATL
jgi:hypothetical protein